MTKFTLEQKNTIFDAYSRAVSERIEIGFYQSDIGYNTVVVLARELGLGINDGSKVSRLERAAFTIDPVRAARIRLNMITDSIISPTNDIAIEWRSSYLATEPHIEENENDQEIDAVLALGIVHKGVQSWLSLVNFYLKVEDESGLEEQEKIARSTRGKPLVAPSVFRTKRPSSMSRGCFQQLRYYPDAPNKYHWLRLSKLSPTMIAGGTGLNIEQVEALKSTSLDA